jgi:hypothetical protein
MMAQGYIGCVKKQLFQGRLGVFWKEDQTYHTVGGRLGVAEQVLHFEAEILGVSSWRQRGDGVALKAVSSRGHLAGRKRPQYLRKEDRKRWRSKFVAAARKQRQGKSNADNIIGEN